jgi:hypothetical protein
MYSIFWGNKGASSSSSSSSSSSDVDHYVIIGKLLDYVLNIFPVFIHW